MVDAMRNLFDRERVALLFDELDEQAATLAGVFVGFWAGVALVSMLFERAP
jgi:hypothetical protein